MAESILQLAAKGDRDAFAVLRDEFMVEAKECTDALRGAELWGIVELLARLTACHGVMNDVACLCGVLIVRRLQAINAAQSDQIQHLDDEISSFITAIMASNDPNAIGSLVYIADRSADTGDDSALEMIERIFSFLDAATAESVRGLVARERELEMAR